MKKCINTIKDNLLLIILVMQPFLDVLAYIQRNHSVSVAGYIRLALTVCMPVYTMLLTKRKKPFLGAVGIIAVFSFLHLLNSLRDGASGIFGDTKYLLLVIHMPVLFFCFLFLYEKEALKKQIIPALIANIIISVLIFYISYFLKSGNSTYPLFNLGWTGWYVIPNAQSLVLVSLLPFAVFFSIKYCKYFFPLVCLPLIYMYTINGTKAAFWSLLATFVAVAGFVLAELVFVKRNLFRVYTVLTALCLIVVSLLCYNYSPRQIIDSTAESNRLQEQSDIDELLKAEIEENIDDNDIDNLKNKNYIYVPYINSNLIDRFGADRVLEAYGENLNSYGLSNMRLKKLIFARLNWEDSDFATRLVGYKFTKMQYNGDNFDLENDPQAILYYYGYIGAALFIVFLGYYVVRALKQLITHFKDTFNLFNFIIFLTLALQLFAAAYSGYCFRRPNVSIYVMIVLLLIYCQTEPLFKKKAKIV